MHRLFKIQTILIALLLTSCAYNASLVRTSYDALQVSQTSYDTAMKIASGLDSQGLLSPELKDKITTYATTFSKAHNLAVEALAQYRETKSLTDLDLFKSQALIASSSLSTLLLILKPYLED